MEVNILRKWKMVMLMGLMVSVLGACQSNNVENIDADKAIELMNDNPEIVLLDVREYNEFVTERIEGSELLPLSIIEGSLETAYPDKDTTFIVYCRSGRRSAEAIEIMLDQGYENIYNLGGILDWPYDTISGAPS